MTNSQEHPETSPSYNNDMSSRDGMTLPIDEVAKLAHVSVRTLRYYDEQGLVPAAKRSFTGRRWYGTAELIRLAQVLILRQIGVPVGRSRVCG